MEKKKRIPDLVEYERQKNKIIKKVINDYLILSSYRKYFRMHIFRDYWHAIFPPMHSYPVANMAVRVHIYVVWS